MLPDFHRLKVFYYIYREGSVSGAAKVLHITQSAVSQHLSRLEKELKAPLFTRISRKLIATQAGDALYARLAPFVAELEEVTASIHRATEEPFGKLRVGAPVEFGVRYLPAAMAAFRAEYPQVWFSLELAHASILLHQLQEGLLDLAYVDVFPLSPLSSAQMAAFSVSPVMEERLLLMGTPAFVQTCATPDADALLQCDFVDYSPIAPATKSWFRHHFDRLAVKPNVVLSVESVRAVIAGIKSGLGLGVVPSHFVEQELADGQLQPIETPKAAMCSQIALAQLQDKQPTKAEKAFLAFFSSWLSS